MSSYIDARFAELGFEMGNCVAFELPGAAGGDHVATGCVRQECGEVLSHVRPPNVRGVVGVLNSLAAQTNGAAFLLKPLPLSRGARCRR